MHGTDSSPLVPAAGGPWPSISFEEHPWRLHADSPVSRRQRELHAGPYRSALAPAIAGREVPLPAALVAECEDAATEVARFDVEMDTLLGTGELAPLRSVLLRSESAASSQIENLTVGARQLALAEIGEDASRNATTVAGNVHAMQAAIDLADRLDGDAILAVHRALMGERDGSAGRWRQEQVWIGGTSAGPHLAEYVAIHHERIPAAIDDLVAFARRTDLPVLAHAALTHAQFETIHPFTDGNGRSGRALIHAMLRHAGLTRRVTVPVSAGLLVDTDAYVDALTAYRRGDVVPIVHQVNEAALVAVGNGRALADELSQVRNAWTARIDARRGAAAWRAIDVVLGQPVVSVSFLADALGVSLPAAQGAIDRLVDAGALTPTDPRRRRGRTWQATEVLAALDAFAARAGRRRVAGS
ncbi:Fic family protein [Oerskovia sp. Sa1BUA8]|uniref:Fic family protein n=1 Tax=Oerskovia douganii TaxID=2762210 RepID=A0A9D5YZS4_9CELL|nr:Fic family protein [Oerskovia douganii]MBE7700359.1 Fic family protein [Oerskovia douganii]